MQSVLLLYLKESATRKTILDQLIGAMSTDQRQSYDVLLSAVQVPEKHHHNIGEVSQTIEALSVPDQVKSDMKGIYQILAQAEAKVHGCEVEHTHFHEVGDGSGIANALAICLAFYVLNPEKVISTPVQTGQGKVQCAHGELDIPAPATAAIIDTGIIVCQNCLPGELCTPTSAALIRYYVDEFIDN